MGRRLLGLATVGVPVGGGGAASLEGVMESLSLLLELRYDEASGNVVNYGSDGGEGTVTGATQAQLGRTGAQQAVLFDGADDVVTIANASLTGLKAVTTQRWAFLVKPFSEGELGSGRFFQWGDSAYRGGMSSTKSIQLRIDTDATDAQFVSNANQVLDCMGKWFWLFFDYDDANALGNGRKIRAWKGINGAVTQLTASTDTAATGSILVPAVALNLGNNTTGNVAFDGMMDWAIAGAGLWTTALMEKIVTLTEAITEPLLPFGDTFSRANGAVKNEWVGTGTIASNALTISPTVGADLFDAGKGTFDSGVNDWVAFGTNTVENDAGELKITYVDNAAGAYCTFRATNVLSADLTVGRWYRLQFDVRVSDGASLRAAVTPLAATSQFFTNTVAATVTMDFVATTTTGHGLSFANMGAGEIVWLDNITLKPITLSTAILTRPATQASVNVKAAVTLAGSNHNPGGVIGWVDSASTPTNYIAAVTSGGSNKLQLIKVVNGTPTLLLNTTTTYGAGSVVEIRRTAPTTYQLWYGGAQIGADQAISDASIISNTIHGLISTEGGNRLDSFFLSPPNTEAQVAYLGGSITAGSTASQIGTNNWVALVSSRLVRDLTDYTFTQQVNRGIGGTPSWYGLIRLQTDVLDYAPELVTVDFACNDISVDASGDRPSGWAPAAEALLRRLRTNLPNARIVVFIFTWPDDYSYLSELQRTVRDKWVALANQYDCTLLRWDTYLEALMGEGYDDSDVEVYLAGANDLHPNDTGHASIADMFMAEVADLEPGWTGNLADYDYYYANQEAADFEHEPIIRTGTDNDGTTGTWSEDGTTLVSSEANATVEWSGTFCSYGFDTTGSTGTIAYSVDGGGEKQMDTSTKSPPFGGYECFERDVHTVTVRVVSGTVKIARFLAI